MLGWLESAVEANGVVEDMEEVEVEVEDEDVKVVRNDIIMNQLVGLKNLLLPTFFNKS